MHADEGRTSAAVSWKPLKATDNDGNIPQITLPPSGVSSPHSFNEGTHTVIYTAKDIAGNTKNCMFSVNVTGMS